MTTLNLKDNSDPMDSDNADVGIRLSLSQILMVASLLVALAVGWGALKTEVDGLKEVMIAHGLSLANMELQITQIRIDMAEERRESRLGNHKR